MKGRASLPGALAQVLAELERDGADAALVKRLSSR